MAGHMYQYEGYMTLQSFNSLITHDLAVLYWWNGDTAQKKKMSCVNVLVPGPKKFKPLDRLRLKFQTRISRPPIHLYGTEHLLCFYFQKQSHR